MVIALEALRFRQGFRNVLEILNLRAGQELAGRRSLNDLFPVILDLALSAINAQRGVILTGDGDELIVRASRGV